MVTQSSSGTIIIKWFMETNMDSTEKITTEMKERWNAHLSFLTGVPELKHWERSLIDGIRIYFDKHGSLTFRQSKSLRQIYNFHSG